MPASRSTKPKLLVALALLIALAMVLAVAGPASAAKGGNGGGPEAGGGKGGGKDTGGSSSLSVVLHDDRDGDGVISHADHVSFDITTTETDQPFVRVTCAQAGTVVYNSSVGYYDGYPWDQFHVLESSAWSGGAASCDAELYKTNKQGTRVYVLATTSFPVAA